jgi:N-acetylglucosaminyldiphosphoundecaprenol N-acetyl-beta-D-mannosaminyltransferase
VKTLSVLGTPLLLTDYEKLGEACLEWARSGRTVAIEFSNTQVVTLRRHDNNFQEITRAYDGFIPDGMPLIWCLNWLGAGLKDRVYGPIFMQKFLDTIPSGYTHYLLGGSTECGERIKARFEKANPRVRFVGSFHGKCLPDGSLAPEDESRVIGELEKMDPDFIWVGFGTPKQQAWIRRYKSRMPRGLLLGVGFAFDVNAGMKRDAPLWMQRLGLTWIFRLCSEPRRLGPRYFKYNFLFLYYLVRDGLGRRTATATDGRAG